MGNQTQDAQTMRLSRSTVRRDVRAPVKKVAALAKLTIHAAARG